MTGNADSHPFLRLFQTTAGLLSIFLCSAPMAEAGIMSLFGDVAEIPVPPSAVLGALEDDELAKIFLERAGVVLGSDVSADVTSPGVVDEAIDLTPGTIAAGSLVDSYLLHFDPESVSGTSTGSITFDRDILGILVVTSSLDATDAGLGALATTYQLDDFRGIEGPGFDTFGVDVNDVVSFLPDLRTVRFDFATTTRIDEIRVVTEAPEPSTAALFVLALAALHRRHRRSG